MVVVSPLGKKKNPGKESVGGRCSWVGGTTQVLHPGESELTGTAN